MDQVESVLGVGERAMDDRTDRERESPQDKRAWVDPRITILPPDDPRRAALHPARTPPVRTKGDETPDEH